MPLGIEQLDVFKTKRNKINESLITSIIGRENEIKNITDYLSNNDYIAISGPAGIGKSRLAVAVIEEYQKNNPDVLALATNAFGSYVDALDSVIEPGNKYILFIDDVNDYNFKELASCENRSISKISIAYHI